MKVKFTFWGFREVELEEGEDPMEVAEDIEKQLGVKIFSIGNSPNLFGGGHG